MRYGIAGGSVARSIANCSFVSKRSANCVVLGWRTLNMALGPQMPVTSPVWEGAVGARQFSSKPVEPVRAARILSIKVKSTELGDCQLAFRELLAAFRDSRRWRLR
jgi:hypothetical protein